MSATSSTLSLVSGSASSASAHSPGNGSIIGDLDDVASPAPTESERSGPTLSDTRDGGNFGPSTTSSRSSLHSLRNNTSANSRGSRSQSPAFSYPTLSEPTQPSSSNLPYESAHPPSPHQGYLPYGFPYAPPPPGTSPFFVPYGYYPYYPPPPPAPPPPANGSTNPSENVSPVSSPGEMFGHPQYPYGYHYWPPMPPPPQNPTHVHNPPAPHPHPSPISGPQGPDGSAYPYPPYPLPGYYHPPMASMPPPTGPPDTHRQMHRHQSSSPAGKGPQNGRTSSRNGNTSPNKRTASHGRGLWNQGTGVNGVGHDVVGPRLNSGIRRTSGASSNGSGSTGALTPGDEASSVAVSSFYFGCYSRHPFDDSVPVILHVVFILPANLHLDFNDIATPSPTKTGLGRRDEGAARLGSS